MKLQWILIKICLILFSGYSCKAFQEEKHERSQIKTTLNAPENPCGRYAKPRNWKLNPPIIEVNDSAKDLYVSGDIHGAASAFHELLKKANLVANTSTLKNPQWTKEKAILVIAGDLINKGSESIQTIELVRTLQTQAPKMQSQVIAVAGNHDIGFLADPLHPRMAPVLEELEASPRHKSNWCQSFYHDQSYGGWIADLPAAAVINGIFISHSGYTSDLKNETARDLNEIATKFQTAVKERDWGGEFNCGVLGNGFFNGNHWWEMDKEEVDYSIFNRNRNALGVKQIMFAHDPWVWNKYAKMRAYFGDPSKKEHTALINLDMGLYKNLSNATLYRCSAGDFHSEGGCKTSKHQKLNYGKDKKFKRLKVLRKAPPVQDNRKSLTSGCVRAASS